jgi:mannose/cellobiose epimerase-like protein (N-acyl-D-glucosamine 2-epimerase family)
MLESTFDTIAKYFPDYDHSPFVQEKFFEDWSHDDTHMWQQNRGVIGHNLKIAWNLMRMYGEKPKPEYETFARKIAEVMPAIGGDPQRGGWYDVLERKLGPNEEKHRFAFHDRKAWWQQEQGILAFLILCGVLGNEEYLKLARESSAFYNAFFLDHDEGAVYFNVLANGVPYIMGAERLKGSHSMSGYHSFELCYLAQVYTNLLITQQPLELYFKPMPEGFKDNVLRVAPDLLPPGRVRLEKVWIDGEPHSHFDAKRMTVNLPRTVRRVQVKALLQPQGRL